MPSVECKLHTLCTECIGSALAHTLLKYKRVQISYSEFAVMNIVYMMQTS